MGRLIKIGTTQSVGFGDVAIEGTVLWDGPYYDEDGTTILIVWDDAIQNVRLRTAAEWKAIAAAIKTEEIYREQEIRSATVWGKEVDRHFFAWVEELYSKILKAASRNAIDATNTPITNGLKLLRDNRVTLLNGLQTWVNDPLKTAEDIAAFDVVNWAGWSVARP